MSALAVSPPVGAVTTCGGCGSDRLELVLDLGASPPACSMPPIGPPGAEAHYPLQLLRCSGCMLAQLSYVVPQGEVFHPDYPYASGVNDALREHFASLADVARLRLDPNDLVVDIGANDGTLLSHLADECCWLLAIDPTNQVWKAAGFAAIMQTPFGSSTAQSVVSNYRHAKVIFATNVLAHVADIHDVLDGIALLLADDGVLIAENHDLGVVVNGGQWDSIYHEHLRYYSPVSFCNLLEAHGLHAERFERVPMHGGSIRTFATKRETGGSLGAGWRSRPRSDFGIHYAGLADSARQARNELRALISGIRGKGERIVGVGATARATTLINYCGLTGDDLDAVWELPGSEKIGRYMPGTRIPVTAENLDDPPDWLLLFSWQLKDRIVPRLRAHGYAGPIIVPLPDPHVLR